MLQFIIDKFKWGHLNLVKIFHYSQTLPLKDQS